MKITNLLAIATTLLLLACNKPAQPVIPQESNFKGTVTVIYQDAPFDNENIEVNFKPSADGKTGSLTIYQIKFVPQMPVTIDVTIPNINVTSTPEQSWHGMPDATWEDPLMEPERPWNSGSPP